MAKQIVTVKIGSESHKLEILKVLKLLGDPGYILLCGTDEDDQDVWMKVGDETLALIGTLTKAAFATCRKLKNKEKATLQSSDFEWINGSIPDKGLEVEATTYSGMKDKPLDGIAAAY